MNGSSSTTILLGDASSSLSLYGLAEQAPAVFIVVVSGPLEAPLDESGDVRVGVYLAVWVFQRDPNLSPPVLEDEDVIDVGLPPELDVPLLPDVYDLPDAVDWLVFEGGAVVVRVEHHLAGAPRRGDHEEIIPSQCLWRMPS